MCELSPIRSLRSIQETALRSGFAQESPEHRIQIVQIESKSLLWKILEASHCESIFYVDPIISISKNPLRMSILRETDKKMSIPASPVRHKAPLAEGPPFRPLSLDRLISI
jgi:hypothetical protein